jgi:hypothetical protein
MSGGWTPGPWRINRIAATNVESASGRGVASTGGFQDGTDDAYLANQANARLIAAAPVMLETLRVCETLFKREGLTHAADMVGSVIAKAEGK